MQFTKATKKRAKARIAIDGPSGSGKTYTALIAATVLADGGKVAGIDTERGSMSLYADKFQFDVLELNTYSPANYVEAIEAAEKAGYAALVIDSLSHAWEGEGGALEMVDNAAAKSQSKNTYFAWRDVTPQHRKLVDAMLQSSMHIVATMRSKTEYIIETDGRGKQTPRKIGMAPIQRAGMEYEFTIVGDMDIDHKIVISKSRCDALADKVETKPGVKFWGVFKDWLNSGEASVETPKPAPAFTSAAPQTPAQIIASTPGTPAPTNGSGAAKREPTLADMETRWSKRWQQAKALGLTVEPIAGAATFEIYKERGKALYAQILTAAKQRTAAAGDVNFDDTDEEIITKAVALANQEPANVTA